MIYSYSDYIQAHPQWKKHIERWQFLSDSYIGGLDYKQGEYLQRYVLETDGEYTDRVRNTPLDNVVKNVVHTYTSFIYSQKIKRDISGLNPDTVNKFTKDADLEGRNFTAFMRAVSIYSSVYGHVWCVVDKPSTPVITLADQQAQNIRPYVSMYSPENVIDWKYSRQPNGVYELTMLNIIESQDQNSRIHKIYYKDRVETVVYETNDADYRVMDAVPNPLGMVPAFVCYSSRSPIRGIGISDVNDIADIQRSIHSELSEIEQNIRLSSHPSLVKTASVEATAGAGAVIQMDDNLDPNLKPYLLETSGEGISGILDSIKQKVAAVERMAHLETARGTRTAMSGVAMLVEQKMLTARLSEKSSNLEHAEEKLWTLFGMWEQTPWTGSVEYPMTFDQRDTAVTLQNIKMAKDSKPMNPKLIEAIDNLIADTLIEDDEEREAIFATPSKDTVQHRPVVDAEDMVTHLREMIDTGYTNQEIMDLHPEIAGLFNDTNNDSQVDEPEQR